MTREEFEKGYVEGGGCTVEGLRPVHCGCGEEDCPGWRMTVTDPVPEGTPARGRWQYCVIAIPPSGSLRGYLDDLGLDGWELVMQNSEQLYIFKRRVE